LDWFDTPLYRIQLCNICFDILANTCGYIKIGEEVEQYRKKIAELEAEVRLNERYHRAVRVLGLSPDSITRLIALGEEPDRQVDADDISPSPKKRSGKSEPAEQMEPGENGPPESTDDEGMDELRPVVGDKSINISI